MVWKRVWRVIEEPQRRDRRASEAMNQVAEKQSALSVVKLYQGKPAITLDSATQAKAHGSAGRARQFGVAYTKSNFSMR